MNQDIIFIAVPVFEGQEFISETLRSIRDQTFTNYRVLISIDNNDLTSAEVCKTFVSDQRFEMVIHSEHLGWARNLNWLIEQCDCPFFIYWQQDDLASTNYLEVLHAELESNESTSISYTDVQWFCQRSERESCPSILGTVEQRIFQAIEQISFIPLRGLIRNNQLRQSNKIPISEDDSSHTEFPFLVELAALGEFRRTGNAMYFKRAHDKNTYIRWLKWQPWRKRRSWIVMGLGFLRVIRKFMPKALQKLAILTILDRLAISRPGRAFFYLPPFNQIEEFVHNFITLGDFFNLSDELTGLALHDVGSFAYPIHESIKKALKRITRMNEVRSKIGKNLELHNAIILETSQSSDGLSLIGFGWSMAESWGIWTDGETATLLLPIIPSGTYSLILEGYHYKSQVHNPEKPVRIFWRINPDNPYQENTMPPGIDTRIKLEFEYDSTLNKYPLIVEFHFPDSVYLPDEHILDHRQVGFGLRKIEIIRSLPNHD